ncbi:glycosyltransferase [Micromonospora purpureochromogenes]|uniref:Glycosyltransferase involved in cell wall biosynthesis n=1 Tax=Micromonospora purpureochromogenes TaxID=47872 RepID=A0ABX2RL81_9ACTN|nr:glycosyltransferase [Micromonospora purpureochromogenes]NYF57272.1 glycosyltransferase involved in cell wall biosynthesis [Micromonospora purpureochromogenes]
MISRDSGAAVVRPAGEAAGDPLLAGRSVALVHEWFGATGGSENVFLAIQEVLPDAKGFVLWRDHDARRGLDLRESWLARTPLRRSKALALPLMPLTWRTLTRERFDVVISSSHAFAHTVKFRSSPDARYLSYIHSPARYLWSPDFDGRGSNGMLTVPRRVLQGADVRLSRHVDSYAANSREVQARIQRFWKRDARIIHPPVDVDYFTDAPAAERRQERAYLLGVGRWIPYKKFDLMIEIAEAGRMPLVIAGSGPEEEALRRQAARVGVPVTFERQPSRQRLRELYWGAKCLLFPTHEDFGIIPVEAMACGTPVLGLRRGGVLETVVDGETGFLVDSDDPREYAAMLGHVDGLDRGRVQAHAARFSAAVFRANVATWVADAT